MPGEDVWELGDAYEGYIGRWSRLVAPRFLEWLAVGPDARWLDVGCGTGALSAQVLADCAPRSVVGVDASPGFVAWASEHVTDPRARFAVGSATALGDDVADAVVSGLVVNFLPDLAAALDAMRVAATGGVVGAYVWDYAGRMDLLRYVWDVAVAVDPAAIELDEGRRFPLCRPAALDAAWRAARLVDVATTAIDVPTTFAGFDDLWTPFLGGQGPAAGYVAGLDADRREALRRRLQDALPIAGDGTIALTARAWAVSGRSPGR